MNSIRLHFDPIRLGGRGQIDPPPPQAKKKFSFKWLMLRLCDLLTFIENIRGSFWPNLRVINNFFELLHMFKVKMKPKKRQKIDFANFESLYHKNNWSYGPKCFGGNVRHVMDHLLASSKNFCDCSKIRKSSLKICLFWPKKSRFSVNKQKTIRLIFWHFRRTNFVLVCIFEIFRSFRIWRINRKVYSLIHIWDISAWIWWFTQF